MTAREFERLPRAQLRIARRTAARLREGGLVFAIGGGLRRRRDFEEQLGREGVAVAAAELDIDADPWEQIIALGQAGATPCVAWTESEQLDSFLGALNLGREEFARLTQGLLVWIGDLDAIESFPLRAPDFWAYRAGVEWVVSACDLSQKVLSDVTPRSQFTYPHDLERATWAYAHDHIARAMWLTQHAKSLIHLGMTRDALSCVADARTHWAKATNHDHFPEESAELVNVELELHRHVGRQTDLLEELAQIDGIWSIPDHLSSRPVALVRASLPGIRALIERGQFERALQATTTIGTNAGDSGFRARRAAWMAALVQISLGRPNEAIRALANADFGTDAEPFSLLARAQLRLLDSVRDAIRSRDLYELAPELLDGPLPRIVDDLCRMGLALDAHRLLDELLLPGELSRERVALLHTLRGRVLMDLGEHTLGFDTLQAGFDDYHGLLAGDSGPVHAMAATGALTVLLEHLLQTTTADAEATQLRTAGLEIARTAIVSAERERQFDLAQTLRSQSAQLLRDLDRVDEAREVLEQNLAWSERNEGPSRICQRHLELARLLADTHHHHQALTQIDRARRALEGAPVDLQPRSVWRELLLDHARTLSANGQRPRARELQIEARERMAAAGLPAEELITLHALAEPLPDEGSDALDLRERAAADALALAAPSGLIYEEARALANYALVHAERGRPGPAKRMLAEARWLTEDLAYGPIRDHIDRTTAAIDEVLSRSNT